MAGPKPIPSGSQLQSQWQSGQPATAPTLPSSWTATVMLSPFGDSIAPLQNYSQLAVGTVECSSGSAENWMRVRLYLTRDRTYFDFVFVNVACDGQPPRYEWYWIDSNPRGGVQQIFGPFTTTLQVPGTTFLSDSGAKWGNAYPLMCTDTNRKGIDCDHWVIQMRGAADHGSWYAFSRKSGHLSRIFTMDSSNPQMIPILGSYYIANVPTFAPDTVSDESRELFAAIMAGSAKARAGYWNPMVTQEDVQRALALPLASATRTPKDIDAVIPGFVAMPTGVALPKWSDKTYIEGWTLGTDFIPYFTRVCYLWTADANSKQQTVFVGLGTVGGSGTYLQRTDTCLNTLRTDQPYFEWYAAANAWAFKQCLPSISGVGLPYPDWLARDKGIVMGQISGNASFGLEPGQALNLIAAQLPRGGGELAIFWLWFLGNGTGTLFTEGNYMNSMSHNLQLIDYNVFVQNADLSAADFSNPCASAARAIAGIAENVRGHLTRVG